MNDIIGVANAGAFIPGLAINLFDNEFDLQTNSDFAFASIVPEPASALTWIGLTGFLMVGPRRRRK